MRSEVLDPI
jgi:hypothetical protein